MTKTVRITRNLLLGLAFLVAAPAAWADDDDDEIPFAEAEIFFELNDTDGDLGIHASIDGEPWRRLKITGPDDKKLLDIHPKRSLRRQGLTQLFVESAEPRFDELSPERFFARFPEGEYEVEGRTLDGREMESETVLSHVLAAPAGGLEVNGIPAAESCDADELPVVSAPIVIAWEPVTESHPTLGKEGPIEVELYQFFVEGEEASVALDLPPDLTAARVPAEVLVAGEEFKFEIIVREATGNQTATESCFLLE